MYHSITFGNKHTYKDWGLVPTTRPLFDMPPAKTVYVDIPGADGSLDLTTSLTGDVMFENRSASFEFQVISRRDWVQVYSNIADYLHGQKMRIVLDDDPQYFYLGRAQINKWKSDKNFSTITIDVIADPYKYELFSSTEDWLWDPFNFETGLIRDYRNIRVEGSLWFTIPGTRKKVTPTFTVVSDDGSGLTLQNRTKSPWVQVSLPDGITRNPKIVVADGKNTFFFTGTGTVTIDYRGGRL